MRRSTSLAMATLIVVASLAPAAPATPTPLAQAAEAERPFARRVAGAWMAAITVPPNPVLGNTEDLVVPELLVIGADGTFTAIPSLPAFPVPQPDGSAIFAALSGGAGNWHKGKGRTHVSTHWRFLADPATGQPIAMARSYAELRIVRGQLVGEYVTELLHPDMTPIELGGQPVVFGPSPMVLTRVASEPLPR